VALLGNLTGSSQFFNDTAFYNGAVSSSLRMQDARLTETPGSTGNSKKWTFSAWIKRGTLADSYIFAGTPYDGYNGIAAIYFTAAGQLHTYYDTSGANPYGAVGSRLFRDTSSWYHLVWAVDAANTIHKIWINNELVSTDTGKYPPNYDYGINRSGSEMVIGDGSWDSYGSTNFNGYMAEINHCDGQYLEPDSFGETKNGVWIPLKDPSLTYGTNGFRLQFLQTGTSANSSGIGADTSGQANHFAVNALAASDVVPDSPENNFCTLNPLQISDNDSNFFPSEGNLKLSANSNSGYRNCSSTFSPMGFKGYFEFTGLSSMNFYLGPIEDTTQPTNQDYADGSHNFLYFISDGQVQKSQGGTAAQAVRSASDHALGTIATGDVLGMAFDFTGTNRNVWLHRANTYGTASGGAGNPATGANPVGTSSILDSARPYRFNFGINNGARLHFNFGQDSSFGGNETAQGNTDENGNGDFYYAPPAGFLALCSANLPEPTIGPNSLTQADDHFNTVLYSGNGGTQNITGFGFQPDWIWDKSRNNTFSHMLVDSSRGVGKYLRTNTNGAEVDDASILTHFISDGVTVGDINGNASGSSSVMWGWKANGGTTSSNSDGSITSTVQANTTAGFSIVTATSPSSGTWSVGHGLSKKPDMIIQKYLASSSRWTVWHNILTSGQYLGLNESNAIASSGTPFNFNITDSVIGGNADYDATSTAVVYYVFHSVDGYSKIGVYNPNNTTDNAFVHTGFKPAMVILKGAEINNQEWGILDNKRPGYNSVYFLQPQSNTTESTSNIVDFLSNGFKIRETGGVGYLTSNYIYMAFAEAPFKYANAG